MSFTYNINRVGANEKNTTSLIFIHICSLWVPKWMKVILCFRFAKYDFSDWNLHWNCKICTYINIYSNKIYSELRLTHSAHSAGFPLGGWILNFEKWHVVCTMYIYIVRFDVIFHCYFFTLSLFDRCKLASSPSLRLPPSPTPPPQLQYMPFACVKGKVWSAAMEICWLLKAHINEGRERTRKKSSYQRKTSKYNRQQADAKAKRMGERE